MSPDVPTVVVCQGTSGMSAGAGDVMTAFRDELEAHSGSPALAGGYHLRMVGDRGLFRDTLVDVVLPDGSRTTYQRVTAGDVSDIVRSHILGNVPVERLAAGENYQEFFRGQKRVVLENCGEIDPGDLGEYQGRDGFAALRKALGMAPEEVVEEVRSSGIRGRGGAGFPTGVKWGFAREAPGGEKYIICNADEGDPGAFMDRSVLEGDPLVVVEGMTIAGYAIGASRGIVYCRAEYPLALRRVTGAVELAREAGLVGDDILGSGHSFDIVIREGAGAFVCGEETALIASLEGRRGMPRAKPPFPARSGLWGRPTVINNVETLASIPRIILRGAEWYRSIGTPDSPGTKVFALAGRVKNTGLVEVPMGTTLRELIFGPGGGMAHGRRPFKAVQIGGPSGGCLPEELLDTSIDYESITATGAIMGSGGMVVMDTSSCMVDIARFFLAFTVAESCGKCVPCRKGLKKMLGILERIAGGEGSMDDLDVLERLASVVKRTALCGLGNTAPNPVLTTLRYFRDEYEAHIKDRRCPASVCPSLIRFEVDPERCTMCGRCKKACPANAVVWEAKQTARIDADRCIRCRACIEACDFGAIT